MLRRVVPFVAALATLLGVSGAEPLQLPEYQVKALFLYNFGKFVDWPPSAHRSGTEPIIIGVLGDDPFGNDLERTVADKKINDRALAIKRFKDEKQLEYCHILFICGSERRRAPQILNSLKGAPTLTVADEIDRFCAQGGAINFVRAGKKVRFEINNPAAQKAGLKISSKLLRLAVGQEPDKN